MTNLYFSKNVACWIMQMLYQHYTLPTSWCPATSHKMMLGSIGMALGLSKIRMVLCLVILKK